MPLKQIRNRVQSRNSSISSMGGREDFSVARAMGGSHASFVGTNYTQHIEQLKHYRGYVYAIIRTIASRIAGQRLRVAYIDDHREESYGDRVAEASTGVQTHGTGSQRGVGGARRRSKAIIQGVQTRKGPAHHYVKTKVPEFAKEFLNQPNAEIVEDHPLVEAFDNPNEIMTGWVMRFMTAASIELTGKGYWLIIPAEESDTGKNEIWPLPASWCEPIHDENKLYKEWKVTPIGMGVPFIVPSKYMVYFYCPDPGDPLGAISPLQAAANAVTADESIEISNTKTFSNGCNPGLALVIGRPAETGVGVGDERPTLTEAQRRQLIETVKAHYRGVLKADEPLILDGLIKDAKRITTNPREMDFLNSSKSTKARLAQMWGVPLTVMGEIENQSRASSAVADDHFLQNVINPRIEMISQVLTKVAPVIFDDGRKMMVFIEKGTSIDADLDLKVEEMLLRNAAMSRNEARSRHGLEPIKDGDSCFFNGIEIPILKEDEEGEASYKAEFSMPGGMLHKRRFQDSPQIIEVKGTLASYIGEGAQVNLWARQLMQLEYEFRKSLQGFFLQMGETIKTHLVPSIKGQYTVSNSMVDEVIASARWTENFKDTCHPHLLRMATTGAMLEWGMHARKYHPSLVQKGFFDMMSGLPRQIGNKVGSFVQGLFSADYWGSVVSTVKESILGGLEEAKSQGDSGRRAADYAVDKALGGIASGTRAASISDTESITALNGGGHESRLHLAQMGAVQGKKWWTVGDEKVRQAHKDAHNQVVAVDAKFVLQDDKGGTFECDFPGDPSLPPHLRCRCRCTVISVNRVN